MDEALLKGQVVSAVSIAKLNDDGLSEIRRQFKCKDCKAEAYFSKGSPKQTPYFAARNHREGCEEAYYGLHGNDRQLEEADTVVIPVVSHVLASAQEQAPIVGTRSRSRTSVSTADGNANTTAIRGVRAVLRSLIENPEFATSSKNIVVGEHKTPASEFFVPFLELTEKHAGRTIGVWGTVFSAREGGAVAWVNRGDEKVKIQIPKSVFRELKTIYKFSSALELSDASFLLVGIFNMHLECTVDDVKQLALRVTVTTSAEV